MPSERPGHRLFKVGGKGRLPRLCLHAFAAEVFVQPRPVLGAVVCVRLTGRPARLVARHAFAAGGGRDAKSGRGKSPERLVVAQWETYPLKRGAGTPAERHETHFAWTAPRRGLDQVSENVRRQRGVLGATGFHALSQEPIVLGAQLPEALYMGAADLRCAARCWDR